MMLRWGSITEGEMLVHARDLVRSPAFRRYWTASRALKAELPADSDEGRMFQFLERAIAESDRGGTPPSRP
ncbi:DUF6082 family protein [Streptomyces sp. H27-C3]|uniref:DUF6082 family protein n=1 Tax=Streptomyces sp. H27-C3 TaxID=3046305 RepID=UPI0024BAB830|nr:DUF6082 family protein [Streptomyces sp. H27-C3]MDJ0463036.1 DUF6082 family protein [Streptomyces sp. H27-C3]